MNEERARPTGPGQSVAIRLEGLRKVYGELVAVDDLGLEIRDGEFLTFLGPSGCGKTTTLRMIAGFVIPDGGRVHVHGQDVTDVMPNARNIGMVYQQYALFPHMSVLENVAFGLRVRKVPPEELRRRVQASLELVRLTEFARRLPRTLSGGQQQRVALARALVIEPEVLLLDEPLSNLDAKLRREMQLELRRLQAQLGITTIYVTHDQSEALAMSDRIAVMNQGRLEQIDTPAELYHHPRTAFVAGFIGQANLLDVTVTESSADGVSVVVDQLWGFLAAGDARFEAGGRALAVVRPEAIFLSGEPRDGLIEADVSEVVYGGASLLYRLEMPGGTAVLVETANLPMRVPYRAGMRVSVEIPPEAITLLPGRAASTDGD